METSLLIDRDDCDATEEEERNLFLRGIIEEIGIPEEELNDAWPELNLSLEDKLKLLRLLEKYDIEIISDGDRGTKVYIDNTLIAEWFKPRYVLMKDLGARTLAKKLYYKMLIKTWSMQENYDKED